MLTDTARFPQRGGLTLNRQRWRARDHHCPTTHLKAKRPGRSAACGCQAGLRGSRAGSHPSRGWQPRTGCWLPPWLPSSAQRGAWQPLGWRAASAPRTQGVAATHQLCGSHALAAEHDPNWCGRGGLRNSWRCPIGHRSECPRAGRWHPPLRPAFFLRKERPSPRPGPKTLN